MHPVIRQARSAIVIMGWSALVAAGAIRLWAYDAAAGVPAHPPTDWPADAHIVRNAGKATLVLLVHPHCPCSRATIGELAKLMTHCGGRLATTVLMLQPAGRSDNWVHTDLWSSAAAIPGVTVLADRQGTESRRFGAATSGQSLLYSADGRLLFAGGITESRGHSGDNAGRSAIESLVMTTGSRSARGPARAPVYGCPLFGPDACQNEGTNPCRK